MDPKPSTPSSASMVILVDVPPDFDSSCFVVLPNRSWKSTSMSR